MLQRTSFGLAEYIEDLLVVVGRRAKVAVAEACFVNRSKCFKCLL